jgi:hypothetical protein
MVAYVLLSLIALALALGVLLLAGSASGETWSVQQFASDLRHGITARRHPAPEQIEAARIAEAEPVDTSMEVFFREAAVDEDPYLNVDSIADTLTRAKDVVRAINVESVSDTLTRAKGAVRGINLDGFTSTLSRAKDIAARGVHALTHH